MRDATHLEIAADYASAGVPIRTSNQERLALTPDEVAHVRTLHAAIQDLREVGEVLGKDGDGYVRIDLLEWESFLEATKDVPPFSAQTVRKDTLQ